jgi:acyl-CoA thioester hydrolase
MNMSITPENIAALPLFQRASIPPDYLDQMGHMNIRWYVGLFDEAIWQFFASFGMTAEYYEAEQAGAFALKQFIQYLAEVRLGETVAIHGRILGRSGKRVHFMMFMLNETTGKLAATFEVLGSHADLRTRRTSAFPAHIAAQIDALLDGQRQLAWAAPVCGVIAP